MTRQHVLPGAIVLGSDFKALGVVRSLGRRGIPSIVIDNQPRSAWFSRYVAKRFRWNGSLDDSAFLQYLLSIGQEHGLEQWLLFPLQDEAVEFVARHHAELSKVYQLVTQDWEIVQWACDKQLTYQLAEEVGIPYPRTWYPKSEDDLSSLGMTFPVIIKPSISIRFQHATRLKALPAGSANELLWQYRVAAAIISPSEIMIQEVIPGAGRTQYSYAAYCRAGKVISSITARRTRQYPIDYGLGSSFVEAFAVPAIREPAEKLLLALGVTGMVEVEFKYDQRDGQYKLLDVNLRPWGWHTLCIACGLDFPYMQYRDILGDVPTPILPRYGYHWVRFLTDIPAGIQERRAGITSVRSYLRSLTGKIVFSVLDWRDPLPVVGDFVVALARSWRGFSRSGKVGGS